MIIKKCKRNGTDAIAHFMHAKNCRLVHWMVAIWISVRLPWIFPGAPLNVQGDLTGMYLPGRILSYDHRNKNMWHVYFCYHRVIFPAPLIFNAFDSNLSGPYAQASAHSGSGKRTVEGAVVTSARHAHNRLTVQEICTVIHHDKASGK